MEFIFILLALAFIVLIYASYWKIFNKAGEAGWKCLIPIYNVVVMCQIAKISPWWTLVSFIPYVSVIFSIYFSIRLSKVFGGGTSFALGLLFLFPIFLPILAFGDAEYQFDEE